MAYGTYFGAVALGGWFLMICQPGGRCITPFGLGVRRVSGIRSTSACSNGRDREKAEMKSRVRQSLTANRSKPVQFEVQRKASTWAKKSGDAKDTFLLIRRGIEWRVKVTAASASDLAGSKVMLEPLKVQFPRLALLWGDSHYG